MIYQAKWNINEKLKIVEENWVSFQQIILDYKKIHGYTFENTDIFLFIL